MTPELEYDVEACWASLEYLVRSALMVAVVACNSLLSEVSIRITKSDDESSVGRGTKTHQV